MSRRLFEAVKIYRSDQVSIEDACRRIRQATRGRTFTEDVARLPSVREFAVSWCKAWYLRVPARIAVQLIASRDTGHHTSGWWKNPDYERCDHLSISAWEIDTRKGPGGPRRRPIPLEDARPADFVSAFFGPHVRLVWEEGPATQDGRAADTHHYRVFCDAAWQPILPRGEVYSRELTEAGWQSWSDVHGPDVRLVTP